MYVGVPTDPPPHPWGARRLTARLADPQGLGQPRGGGPRLPTPLQPPKLSHTPRGHTLAGGGPHEWDSPPGTPTPSRLLQLTASNASNMVVTFVPNEVKNVARYRLSSAVATENLGAERCPETWWFLTLRRSATRGLHYPPRGLWRAPLPAWSSLYEL